MMGQSLPTAPHEGTASFKGALSLQVVRRKGEPPPVQSRADFLRRILHEGLPTMKLDDAIRVPVNQFRRRNMRHLLSGVRVVLASRALKLPTLYGALDLTPIFRKGTPQEYTLPLGLVGLKVVTTAGVGYICDAFQNLTELENFKFHALGTGVTAEDVSDVALVTELTTQYTGNVRATGNLAEGASANIFHTEATNTLDETPGAALREHGVFSAVSAGVLLDRTLFAAITLSAGDALLSKYELTLSAGS
jgi:hypothetical protein